MADTSKLKQELTDLQAQKSQQDVELKVKQDIVSQKQAAVTNLSKDSISKAIKQSGVKTITQKEMSALSRNERTKYNFETVYGSGDSKVLAYSRSDLKKIQSADKSINDQIQQTQEYKDYQTALAQRKKVERSIRTTLTGIKSRSASIKEQERSVSDSQKKADIIAAEKETRRAFQRQTPEEKQAFKDARPEEAQRISRALPKQPVAQQIDREESGLFQIPQSAVAIERELPSTKTVDPEQQEQFKFVRSLFDKPTVSNQRSVDQIPEGAISRDPELVKGQIAKARSLFTVSAADFKRKQSSAISESQKITKEVDQLNLDTKQFNLDLKNAESSGSLSVADFQQLKSREVKLNERRRLLQTQSESSQETIEKLNKQVLQQNIIASSELSSRPPSEIDTDFGTPLPAPKSKSIGRLAFDATLGTLYERTVEPIVEGAKVTFQTGSLKEGFDALKKTGDETTRESIRESKAITGTIIENPGTSTLLAASLLTPIPGDEAFIASFLSTKGVAAAQIGAAAAKNLAFALPAARLTFSAAEKKVRSELSPEQLDFIDSPKGKALYQSKEQQEFSANSKKEFNTGTNIPILSSAVESVGTPIAGFAKDLLPFLRLTETPEALTKSESGETPVELEALQKIRKARLGASAVIIPISASTEVLAPIAAAASLGSGVAVKGVKSVIKKTILPFGAVAVGEGVGFTETFARMQGRGATATELAIGGSLGFATGGLSASTLVGLGAVGKKKTAKALYTGLGVLDPSEVISDVMVAAASREGTEIVVEKAAKETILRGSKSKSFTNAGSLELTSQSNNNAKFQSGSSSSSDVSFLSQTNERTKNPSVSASKVTVSTPSESIVSTFSESTVATPESTFSDITSPVDTPTKTTTRTRTITEVATPINTVVPTLVTAPTSTRASTRTLTQVSVPVLTSSFQGAAPFPFVEFNKRRSLKKKSRKVKTKYTPGFTAIAFGITTTKKPTGQKVFSGSEIRPIVVPDECNHLSKEGKKLCLKNKKKKKKVSLFGGVAF